MTVIETKNQFGQWIKVRETSDVQPSIHQALKATVENHPIGRVSKVARAMQNGVMVDIMYG